MYVVILMIMMTKPYDGLDENKAYTQCLMNIKQIPIFNYFDVYKVYNNEPIEDLSQYIIEVLSYTSRTAIIFLAKYTENLWLCIETS